MAAVVDIEAEKRAILRVIEIEGEAYLKRDYETYARCWSHTPHARRWIFHAARGIFAWQGWEEESRRMRELMTAHPRPSPARYRRDAIDIRVSGALAWVTFEQSAIDAEGPLVDLAGATAEMRVMEKHADGWKIVCVANFHRTVDHIASPLVRVNQDGVVISKNGAAEKALHTTRRVAVRGGRLRAADRAVDQRLQTAIRWAATLDDGTWPRHGSLPVVLGGGHGEPVDVCWVMAHNSQTLVAFDSHAMIEDRLAAAEVVYGITPAQMRLAALIVAGHDIVGSARQLGVTVNTARTQLKRMFEKTGVRTQASLVRALLSVSSPLD
jgi:DNA-binding CsgD family transcriptional regulator